MAAFFLSRRRSLDWLQKLSKKEHSLYALYPMSDWILSKTGLYKSLIGKKDIGKYLGAFEYSLKPELAYRLHLCKRVATVLLILIAFNLLSMLSALTSNGYSYLINGLYLKRPGHGEGTANVKLQVKMVDNKDSSETAENEEYGPYDLIIPVFEQAYNSNELEEAFEKAFLYVKSKLLADNASFDQIYGRLNFIKNIPGTAIKVKWIPDDYRLIGPDGSLKNDSIDSEGVWTNITAVLTYEHNEDVYSREYLISLRIMPKKYEREELLQRMLKESVRAAGEESRTEDSMKLPEELADYRLIWNEEQKENSSSLLALGILLAAVAWIGGDRELAKRLKQRKDQMLIDYPEIINKFTLLVNAGMTIKQAWLKITDDYERQLKRPGNKRRYAYDEFAITARELRLGVPESVAYEQFGKRTGLIQYIKFASLLNQNLKKGNRNLTQQLIYEAQEAFAERKELAKRLGETAGTRLLGPMMAMLLIVLLMIMIPAFMSFKI